MAYIFILLGVVFRLIPHLPNATPVAAIALFGGTYLDRRAALVVPLLIMIVSDMFLGLHSLVIFTWGAFLLTGLIGLRLKGHKTLPNIIGSTLLSSILFFVITNFGVWAVPASWYPHTLQGLLNCYVMGLPFFRYTLIGDMAYVGILFGLFEAVKTAADKFTLARRSI
jgi:hypothetical protein